MEADKEKGKPRNYQGYLKFDVQETWVSGPDTVLEDADINNQITLCMKKFKYNGRLFKTPGHRSKSTDISLWKQYRQPYLSSRTEVTIRPFRCTAVVVVPKFDCASGKITSVSNLTEFMMSTVTQRKTNQRNSITSKSLPSMTL
jgi:hypothetical protein